MRILLAFEDQSRMNMRRKSKIRRGKKKKKSTKLRNTLEYNQYAVFPNLQFQEEFRK